MAGNAAGIPAITVPNGFGGSRGLPQRAGIRGRAFDENRLIAVASAFQSATHLAWNGIPGDASFCADKQPGCVVRGRAGVIVR